MDIVFWKAVPNKEFHKNAKVVISTWEFKKTSNVTYGDSLNAWVG